MPAYALLPEGGTAPRALALSGLLIVVVALGDYLVGYEITFSIFYLLPISVASWYGGARAGYVVSFVSAVLWLTNDTWLNTHEYSAAWIPYWNATMRLFIFLIVSTLLATWQVALHEAREAYAELDGSRKEQLALKDQILSHVSHELRTPLTATQQFLSIVRDGIPGPVNEKQGEYLDIALRNVNQLTRMIGDLLETTRTESGKLTIELTRVRVQDLLTETVRTLRSPASERGIDLQVDISGPLPDALADPARVRQIVGNLLENALKFTPAEGRVTVRAAPYNGSFVRVAVEDTGRGIPPEAQKRLFQRLFQAETEDASSRRGLGLGLFIARELVSRQGGRIWVDSEVGRGSTFQFTLPVAPEA